MWALGEAGGLAAAAAQALLDRLVKESDSDRREKIVEVLGDIGDRSQPVARQVKLDVAAKVRPALEKAVAGDGESDVRRAALRSLDRLALEPAETVAILAKTAAASRDDELTWSALQALRNRGLEAAPALETIRSLSGHKNPQTAEYAATIARELADEIARGPAPAPLPPASAATAAGGKGRAPAPPPAPPAPRRPARRPPRAPAARIAEEGPRHPPPPGPPRHAASRCGAPGAPRSPRAPTWARCSAPTPS